MTNSLNTIQNAVEKGEQISPFLFLSSNISDAESEIESLIEDLQNIYRFPATSVFHLQTETDTLKTKDVRSFVEMSSVKSSYDIQIFIIHDIGKLTV